MLSEWASVNKVIWNNSAAKLRVRKNSPRMNEDELQSLWQDVREPDHEKLRDHRARSGQNQQTGRRLFMDGGIPRATAARWEARRFRLDGKVE